MSSTESESELHLMEAGLNSESESGSEKEEEQESASEEEQESGSETEEEQESESEKEESGPGEEQSESEEEDNANSYSDKNDKGKIIKKEEIISTKQPVKKELKEKILEKYKNQKGKSLFIRFPHKIPTNQETLEKSVKELCNRIIKVRRPKQKNVRFCLVDFDNSTDRNKALQELQKIKVKGEKLYVAIPKTEEDEFVQTIIEKKVQKRAGLKEKSKLRKIARKEMIASGEKKSEEKTKPEEKTDARIFTSTIILQNIPSEAEISNIKELFPKAVNIMVHPATGNEDTKIATIEMPTTKDATITKRNKYKIGDNTLIVRYAVNHKGKKLENVGKQKTSIIGKHKLERSSTNDSSSPKKQLKNENAEGDTIESKKQKNKNVKIAQKKIKKEKAVLEAVEKKKNLNKPKLQNASPKESTKPFSKSNKSGEPFKKTNKFGKPFSKTNKSGELIKQNNFGKPFIANKFGKPFSKGNKSGDSFSNANKSGEPFKKANKFGKPFNKTNKTGETFSKTNKSGEQFKRANKSGKPFKKV